MGQHPPKHPNPTLTAAPDTGAGLDRDQPDVVAGDPPVPITVWRTARTPTDAGHPITARLATRLVAAYSRPGDAVVDLTNGQALTAACAVGRRRHHPAWFTDTPSVVIGPASPPAPASMNEDGDAADEPPDLRAWFGDDLTDPDLPPPASPTPPPMVDRSASAACSLVVAGWPLHTGDAANRVRLAWLLTAGTRLLRLGGCLILVVAVPSGIPTGSPEDFSPVVAAAAGVGLSYLQHIVAVTADTDRDTFVYHAADEELLTLARAGHPSGMPHLRVHADLLVFSHLQPTAPAGGGQRGGGRRG